MFNRFQIYDHHKQCLYLNVLNVSSTSAGSILDISKYRDTCERSISILDGIAITSIYRMIRRYLGDIGYIV